MSALPVLAIAWLLLISTWTARGAADSTLALSYRAPGAGAAGAPRACPTAAEFRRAIQSRGADLEAAGVAARASSVDVSIRYANGEFIGELAVQARDGAAASRVVHDARGDAVASGLAMTAAIALRGAGSAAAVSAAAEEAQGLDGAGGAPVSATTDPGAATEAAARDVAGSADPNGAAGASEPEPRLRGSSFGRPAAVVIDAGELRFDGARAYTLTAGAALGPIPGQLLPRYDLTASLASFVTPPGGESSLFGPFQVHWAVLGPVQTRYAGDVSLDAWGLEAGVDTCSATAKPRLRRRSICARCSTHTASIWRLLRRLGVRREQLDDASQEVFWVAARRLADIRAGSEHAFLYGVALRVASDATRRRYAEPCVTGAEPLEDLAIGHPNPEEHLERRRALELLDLILDRLPLELRTVFVLFELEGLRVRDITELEGLPEGTVNSRLRRAREEFSAAARRMRAQQSAREGVRG